MSLSLKRFSDLPDSIKTLYSICSTNHNYFCVNNCFNISFYQKTTWSIKIGTVSNWTIFSLAPSILPRIWRDVQQKSVQWMNKHFSDYKWTAVCKPINGNFGTRTILSYSLIQNLIYPFPWIIICTFCLF